MIILLFSILNSTFVALGIFVVGQEKSMFCLMCELMLSLALSTTNYEKTITVYKEKLDAFNEQRIIYFINVCAIPTFLNLMFK